MIILEIISGIIWLLFFYFIIKLLIFDYKNTKELKKHFGKDFLFDIKDKTLTVIKNEIMNRIKMKIGDTVKMSDRNPNHLGYGVDAYAGMTGIVTEIYEDNGFCLDCGSSILVVPMSSPRRNVKGRWIWLNDELIFHKKLNVPTSKPSKKN